MPSPADFLPHRGQVSRHHLVFDIVRPLSASDLLDLSLHGAPIRTGPPPIQKITATHHRAAQLIAQGMSAKDVAREVGRTPQRIRDLGADPTFKELVNYYQNQVIDIAVEGARRSTLLATEVHELALDEIRERLEDDEVRKQIPTAELRQIARDFGDRTVLPPKATQTQTVQPTNITFNIAGRGIQAPTPVVVIENPSTPPTTEHQDSDPDPDQ